MQIIENKYFTELVPEEGLFLYKDGEIFDRVACPPFVSPDEYLEVTEEEAAELISEYKKEHEEEE